MKGLDENSYVSGGVMCEPGITDPLHLTSVEHFPLNEAQEI